MEIFFYALGDDLKAARLLRTIQYSVGDTAGIEVFRSVDEFGQRAGEPRIRPTVSVIVPNGLADLADLAATAELQDDFKTIVALPSDDSELKEAAYRLKPRFVGMVDDETDITAVLLQTIVKTRPGGELAGPGGAKISAN